MKIRETKDYGIFKLFHYNRKIANHRVTAISKSINKHGFIIPILVTKSMHIIDGQHRFLAAKQINKSIKYIILDIDDKDLLPLLIADMNTNSKNWIINDYYNLWLSLEKEEYLKLESLRVKYDFPITVFIYIFRTSLKGSLNEFRNGELIVSDETIETLTRKMENVNSILDLSDHLKELAKDQISFVKALLAIIRHKNCDFKYFFKKIKDNLGKIQRCSSIEDYIILFENIYNHSKKYKIIFSKSA